MLADPDSEQRERAPQVIRRLKLLVALLILSNVGLGVFGFVLLHEVDHKYTALIKQSVPALNDLQTLTAVTSDAMRGTNPTLYGDSAEARAASADKARTALTHERELRVRTLEQDWFPGSSKDRNELQQLGENFNSAARDIVTLLGAGTKEQASQKREEVLRPLFDRYLSATTKAADRLEEESLRTSDSLTERTSHISRMLLGAGSWPMLLLGVIMVSVAVMVTVILFQMFLLNRKPL